MSCSSEANDLALRIARQHTGTDDVIIVDRYRFNVNLNTDI